MAAGDAEATSLVRWLGFYAANAQEDCVSIVLRLLNLAFPATLEELTPLSGWKAVMMMLEGFYETSLAVDVQRLEDSSSELDDALQTVLALVLAAVVQCEAKEKFVKDILTMEDVVQADLMKIIERVMAQGASTRAETVVEEKKKKLEATVSPGLGSPLYLSRNAALERVKRENGVLKEENIHLARELEQTTKKFREVEGEKEKMVEIVQHLKEQVDSDVLRKERSMHALFDERIQTLQLHLNSTKAELKDKTALASEVPALRDEVDLLRPLADKTAKMDATVARYKAKIDELSGAKDSLRRLKGTNTELVEKNLVLERELAKAASWQRKLKEAKEANTDVEFRVSELETLLFRERQELSVVRADLEAVQDSLQEAKTLNVQLQESVGHQLTTDATQQDSSSSAPAMAGGISEFNPELMQKLTRLEYENSALKKAVDGETRARIDSLLDEVDDLTRLKKSFEKKYFDTQQTLQTTKSEFKQIKIRLESTIAELQASIGELREWQLSLEEDVTTQALEKQSVVAERDRLAAELYDGIERERHLNQAVSNRDHELSGMREANVALACRNERLVQQCESLSKIKQELETNQARQTECAAMQIEDASAEWLRLQQQKTRELNQVCRQYEEQAADIISRMTLLVDSKSAEIVQLTSKLQEVKLEHDTERHKLEAAHIYTAKELVRYQEQYSVSNTDWSTKEEELNNRVKELERQCRHCVQQEKALKSTIKSQLLSNARLVEKNKVLKADAVETREMIAKLESTITLLESKVVLLEKERTHYSTQEERKRGVEDGMSSYSSQLSTQVSLVVAELERVLKENKELHVKLGGCRCGSEPPPRSGTPEKAKNYYLNRIQQLEYDKQQVDLKRRELLLVNAKLIQEQKQLHVKNVSLSDEVHELMESLNHWRLRDERRRKKEGQPRLAVENKPNFASPCAKRASASTKDQSAGIVESPTRQEHKQQNSQKTSTELPTKSQTSSRDSSVPRLTSSPTGREDVFSSQDNGTSSSNKTISASVGKRKRKLEQDYPTLDVASPTKILADSTATSNFTDAQAFFTKPPAPPAQSSLKPSSEPRSKRRLSHFITRSLAPDKNKQHTEKPSECKQQ